MTEPDRITAHAHDTTHVATGLSRLVQKLRERPALAALLSSWLSQVQELEDAAWSLYGLAIDTSSGAALDQLGEVLGAARPASDTTDAVYRRVLRAAVIALASSGDGDEALRATHALLDSWDFTLTLLSPATMLVRPDDPPDIPATVIRDVLKRVKSAGVGLQVVDVPAGSRFRFSASRETPATGSAHGFGDESGTPSGGVLVGVVR